MTAAPIGPNAPVAAAVIGNGVYYSRENDDVLPNRADGSPADLEKLGEGFERVAQENDSRRFRRNVVRAADRNADLRRGQRRRVVQAIADHRDRVAVRGGVLDALQLFFRQQAGGYVVQPDLMRNGFRGALAVAGQHGNLRDLQMLQLMHRLASALAELDREPTPQPAAEVVFGDQHRGRAVAVGFFQQRLQAGDVMFRQKTGVARSNGAVPDPGERTAARYDAAFIGLLDGQSPPPGFVHDGARQHVFRTILGVGRQRQYFQFAAPRPITLMTPKRPSVTVPVLSKKTVSTLAAYCSTAPPRTRMPRRASPPIAATIAAGVARISAHGQATINTDTVRIQSRVK